MDNKRIVVTVVGARPQFIKAAVLSKAIRDSNTLVEVMVHTGQHYDLRMSDTFFDELEIPQPRYSLGVGSGGHGHQTGEMMKQLESVLEEVRPSAVVVYGDTNSTLAGALAAAKMHIPVVHVEAGLRSFNKKMPEEINRILTDHVSSLLFCPTHAAIENLAAEGIRDGVFKTGDVMYDVARQYALSATRKSSILNTLNLHRSGYLLATVHRAENTDDPQRLKSILRAFSELSREMQIVLPLHPRTRKMIGQYGMANMLEGTIALEPVGFLDMLMLVSNAAVIGTDSGGVQKEAYFHRIPCVTLRDQTEWTETITAGWNVLAKADSTEQIVDAIHQAMKDGGRRQEITEYGDGSASRFIVNALARFLENDGRVRKVEDLSGINWVDNHRTEPRP